MASAIDSSDTVYTAQRLHGLSATASAALGRLLTAASVMGAMQKQEHATLTLRINGGGPIGTVTAISDSHGNVRGCVDNPNVDVPLKPNGKLTSAPQSVQTAASVSSAATVRASRIWAKWSSSAARSPRTSRIITP